MKTARNSSSTPYECKQPWEENIFVQCGDSGVVFKKEGGGYTTAFFEAFPKRPSCFLRGEGKTVEEAEKQCWDKYQKVKACEHEMERRDRTDGYGYCKHCSYSSMVFDCLNKCRKCKKPTNFSRDAKSRYYCRQHRHFNRNNKRTDVFGLPIKVRDEMKRLPRKKKAVVKQWAKFKFEKDGIQGKVRFHRAYYSYKFLAGGYVLNLIGEKKLREILKLVPKNSRH